MSQVAKNNEMPNRQPYGNTVPDAAAAWVATRALACYLQTGK